MSESETYLSKHIYTLFSFDTEYCADSVEWCPHKPNQNVFVCANYQLQVVQSEGEEKKRRLGRILLFSVKEHDSLILHQTIDTAGVLDQKWCHSIVNGYSLLGVVNSINMVEVYKLKSDKIEIELVTSIKNVCDCDDALILSLDWSTGVHGSQEPEIICSDSKGGIHLMKLVNNSLVLLNTWHGHKFEAWISAFYYWDTNIFFSGGDDGIFLKFDKRVGNQIVGKNQSHHAGVTSLHTSCFKENILVSGSYDENIRLWDIRNIKNEVNSSHMPGPVWRVKWNPFYENYLLAVCMMGGVHILDVEYSKIDIIGSYHEHKSISYGADWSYLDSECGEKNASKRSGIIATCSFYDHLLCVSKYVTDTRIHSQQSDLTDVQGTI
ncbi:hypothetical protein NQ315_005999 [Exocentrus adspersus]|uniref:methylated diphthine methylhydrolase n=1 Tax=Exocentrus adspersus TaxID=1586481 RepID=A0AAV8VC43_9CUCU|nr:hypothetical protein NQ315_005999 [Exocentrus adspersus]